MDVPNPVAGILGGESQFNKTVFEGSGSDYRGGLLRATLEVRIPQKEEIVLWSGGWVSGVGPANV
jgi:hypothetical protein